MYSAWSQRDCGTSTTASVRMLTEGHLSLPELSISKYSRMQLAPGIWQLVEATIMWDARANFSADIAKAAWVTERCETLARPRSTMSSIVG
eukprot:CAMPEP_0117618156 /NCGR_PEP_ID=MMETSP0784-20121206/85956_1 /TAXON_ID=39447 /ORGANISM="" /LENGTH=90 /DNA_ID=CAMNT_0005422007 /DNA_START=160 /DNA_END=432 /DNA_ORIENTATION=-